MILVDKANNIENGKVVLADIATFAGKRIDAVSVLATGTFTGTPKLVMSIDGTNFVPLYDDNGDQVELTADIPVHLRSANVWVKVDLTGVVSSDLKVEIA
ncbi:MAG: hypothetical protein II972_01595 [Elusimicrobiaceae bacterium]|nr:hypothetical protein [Elusimicrobiaceae bacterium]